MASPLRSAMVYLGLAEEEEYEPQPAPRQAAAAAQPRAQVTPLRRAAAPRSTGPAEMNEILTVHPREYNKDARTIAEHFREGVPVIINVSQMSEGDARRLIDFASGLVEGLSGRIEKVTSKVFLLSPAHVHISGEASVSLETGPVLEY